MSRATTQPFAVARWALAAVVFLVAVFLAVPASALTTTGDELARTLEADGRIVEVDQSAQLDAAIDRANAAGVVVAVLDRQSGGEAVSDLAETLNLGLDGIGSSYHSVLVITNNGYGANSWTATDTELALALDESFEDISSGNLAAGVDVFVETLPSTGVFLPSPNQGDDGPTGNSQSPGGGGLGLGRILAVGGILGGVLFLVRRLTKGRRDRELAHKQLELDRAEIVEQLRANADRVISLGDRVIISENAELIALYEAASATYQAVSAEVDSVSTPEEVDALDDRIDTAEWQLAVIEAELDGKPRPPRPAETADSVEQRVPATEADSRPVRIPPRSQPSPRPIDYGSRRTGSTGGLGGVLGSILGNIVIGGGGLGGSPSRRTRRRTGSGFPSSGGFGFPSGRSGARSSRSSSRRRSSSGGRTVRRQSSGRRRSSKGGRSF